MPKSLEESPQRYGRHDVISQGMSWVSLCDPLTVLGFTASRCDPYFFWSSWRDFSRVFGTMQVVGLTARFLKSPGRHGVIPQVTQELSASYCDSRGILSSHGMTPQEFGAIRCDLSRNAGRHRLVLLYMYTHKPSPEPIKDRNLPKN